ncbi:hypothetical protein LINGRAHAP2_LOCUS17846, partial [Linum grandiflorum]
ASPIQPKFTNNYTDSADREYPKNLQVQTPLDTTQRLSQMSRSVPDAFKKRRKCWKIQIRKTKAKKLKH